MTFKYFIALAKAKAVFSGLNAFTVSITCYHCTSPPLVPTHQVPYYQRTCNAPLQARG